MSARARKVRVLIAVLLLTVVFVFAVSGCSGEPARGVVDSGLLQAQYVDLPDGRLVVCVTGNTNAVRVLSCDWPHAALEGEPSDTSGE